MSPPPDESDLATLIDRWRGPLVGLFLARGLDRAVAWELAEGVFVEAWLGLQDGRYRGATDDAESFGPWLRGIARNLASAHLRSARRAPRVVDHALLAEVAQPEAPATGREPALREAIDRLPTSLREVVFVRYLNEHTGREAAALLGLTEKAVERRAARARALLKELMASDEENR